MVYVQYDRSTHICSPWNTKCNCCLTKMLASAANCCMCSQLIHTWTPWVSKLYMYKQVLRSIVFEGWTNPLGLAFVTPNFKNTHASWGRFRINSSESNQSIVIRFCKYSQSTSLTMCPFLIWHECVQISTSWCCEVSKLHHDLIWASSWDYGTFRPP